MFDTRLMVMIDFMVQEVLMRAPKLRSCCGSDKHKEVGAAGNLAQATFKKKWRD